MLTVWDTPIIVDIETVLVLLAQEMKERTGLEYFGRPVPTGSNVMVKCPFHHNGQERRPSMGLRIDSGQFNCFTCGAENGNHGDFPLFIAKCLDMGVERDPDGNITKPPKPELGYKWLLKKFNLAVQGERPLLNLGQTTKNAKFTNFLPEEELDKYYEYTHPYMLEARHVPQKIQDFLEIGYDRETNSVTFPMRDIRGRIVYIKKRPISSYNEVRYANVKDIPKKNLMFGAWALHKNLNLTPKEWMIELVKERGLLLVEGEIDVASGWTLKWPTSGIGGRILFEEQVGVLKRLGVRKIILGFDNDEEGQKEIARAQDRYSKDFRFGVLKYPDWAKDMNDVIKEGKDLSSVTVI